MTARVPSGDFVGVHWLRTIPGVPAEQINTTVPEKSPDFEENGFIQVSLVSGSMHPNFHQFSSLLQTDTWAYQSRSKRPPWYKAASLASEITMACPSAARSHLVLPHNYVPVRVFSVLVEVGPMRFPSDAEFARYRLDLRMYWTPLEEDS